MRRSRALLIAASFVCGALFSTVVAAYLAQRGSYYWVLERLGALSAGLESGAKTLAGQGHLEAARDQLAASVALRRAVGAMDRKDLEWPLGHPTGLAGDLLLNPTALSVDSTIYADPSTTFVLECALAHVRQRAKDGDEEPYRKVLERYPGATAENCAAVGKAYWVPVGR